MGRAVDLKAAFDSVDQLALWKALRGIGIPRYLLQLIEDLHNGSTSSVRIGAILSLSLPVSSPPPVSDRAAFSPLLCSAVQLTGLWSELPPELVSHWATTASLTWIMQMTLSSSLTKWMTFIVPWRFLRQRRHNSAYMYPGRRRRFRIWVKVEEVTEFTYLGSVQSTTGRCQPAVASPASGHVGTCPPGV